MGELSHKCKHLSWSEYEQEKQKGHGIYRAKEQIYQNTSNNMGSSTFSFFDNTLIK